MRFQYHSEQWLPFSVELVFAFFANPENLPRLMPTWQKARIEEASFAAPPPRPASTPRFPGIAAGSGTKMTISFRPVPLSPLRVPWDAEISDFVWNDHFCDIQTRGPFAYWHHCHRVAPLASSNASGVTVEGTLLQDEVTYELPFGALGVVAQKLFVPRQMAYIFNYRKKRTAELLPRMASAVRKC